MKANLFAMYKAVKTAAAMDFIHQNSNIVTWVNVLMDDTTEYRRPTIQGVVEYVIFYQICDKVSHMQKQYFLESSALKLTL